jgi:Trk K+ transport system NAD-binding subunit
VHFDSKAAGQAVKSLPFPKECLLIAIRREGKDIIPSGETLIRADDYLVFLINERDETEYREMLTSLTTVA